MTFIIGGTAAADSRVIAPSGDTSGAEDTGLVNEAVDGAYEQSDAPGGAAVELDGGVFWGDGIALKSRVAFRGGGVGSTRLKAAAGSAAAIVGSAQVAGNSMQGIEIAHMVIDGNRQNGATGMGINYQPVDQTENVSFGLHDPGPRIHDLVVMYTANYGIQVINQPIGAPDTGNVAACHAWLESCFVYGTGKSGYHIGGYDCQAINCQAGATKEHGFLIASGSFTARDCKAWYAGLDRTSGEGLGDVATTGMSSFDGYHINANILITSLVGCMGQDNGRHDVYIGPDANGTALFGMVFGGSYQTCVYIDGAHDCTVDGHLQSADRFNPAAMVTFNGAAAVRNRVSMTWQEGGVGVAFFTLTGGATMESNTLRGMPGEGAIQAPAYTASYTPNLSLGDTVDMTLTGNISIGAMLANWHPTGMRFRLILTQDATGGRTVTWHASYTTRGTPAAINSAANARTVYEFVNVSLTATPDWQVV
jgi:hypothetical protein